MGGTDGMEIPSLSSLLLLMQILFPPGPNHSYMFLFTFLHPKWDNPTCHLTQSFMHTGLFFFFLQKKHWQQAAGMKCFGVDEEKNAVCGYCIFDNISSSWQEKCNASFENQRYFFKLKHPEQQNKKLECFEQEKVLGKALL